MEIIRFERIPVPDFSRWLRESGKRPSRHWEKVSACVDGVRSLTLLAQPYAEYFPTEEGVELSAFYVASNALHLQDGKNTLNIPVKPLIAGYGIGAYGRNGLISIPGIGTRFAAAVAASDEMPDAEWRWDDDRPLAGECAQCRACADACPVSALSADGCVDVDRCLRAQAQYQTPPMPDASKALIGPWAWGCETCQQVCPRNSGVVREQMPEELERGLELKRLLAGDVKALGAWIGTNYARPARMQARACILAANLGRRDLLDDIGKLLNSPVEPVRDCARWALETLRNGGI